MPTIKETLEVARWHLESGRVEEAEALYAAVLSEDPKQAEAHRGLGQLALGKADLQQAIERFGLALEHGAEEAGTYLDLGVAYHLQKRFEDAEAVLGRALVLDPDSLETHDALAMAIAEQGDLTRARDQLAEALERISVEQPDREQAKKQAVAFFNLGTLNQRLGQLEGAAAGFRVSHHYDQSRPEALQNLGLVYALQQDWEKAIDCLERALLRDPGHPLLLASLGEILLAAGRSEEAVEALRKASKLMPANAEAHQCLARALMAAKRWTEAAKSYGDALRLQPKQAESGLELALALKQSGRISLALTAIEQALSAEPDLAAAHALKGELFIASGDLEKGFAAMHRALSAGDDGKAPALGATLDITGQRIGIVANEDILTLITLLRFLPALRARAAHVVCVSPTALRGLLRAGQGIDEWASGFPPKLDQIIGIFQLPAVLEVFDPAVSPLPYLKASHDTQSDAGLRIGVAPKAEDDDLGQLLEDWGQEAVDLRKLRADCQRWEDWINALGTLDLVVGSDQIALAMAAACGIPGHLLLGSDTHWCWAGKGEASPWYPNVRLYRGPTQETLSHVRGAVGLFRQTLASAAEGQAARKES
ncbi:MAG: tetratricopeptide repeat protein [Pseudomonadota bacterium]